MPYRRMIPAVVAAVLGLSGAAAAVYATQVALAGEREDEDDDNEARILESAKITLSEAIAAAERETGGKAIDAGIEDDGAVHFEVEIAKDKEVQKVLVDPQTGMIVNVAKGDDDEEEEKVAKSEKGSDDDDEDGDKVAKSKAADDDDDDDDDKAAKPKKGDDDDDDDDDDD
jgi:uncharacterized membrane protein YkoI